ncbi:MAG: DUF2281 domain-containing protein [Nitrospinae bacterium]|nr:DUF2281 domain-containing protein [Nitrospinota bacterium]
MEKGKIWSQFMTLPPEGQQEVTDFIAFLFERYKLPFLKKRQKKRKAIKESFVGLWKNRKDLQDSTSWTRRIRKQEWAS